MTEEENPQSKSSSRRADKESTKVADDVNPASEEDDTVATANGIDHEGSDKQNRASSRPEDVESTAGGKGKALGVYLVRIPRIEVDRTLLRSLESELESLNKQVNIINAAVRVKRIAKQNAMEKTNAAKEKFRSCADISREKLTELAPYRDQLRKQQEEARKVRDLGRDLQCKTEPELIAKIDELELTIAHGELTLNEEKELVKRIKKLRTQRESVIEYGTSREAVAESKLEIGEIKGHLDILNSELDILKQREKTHKKVYLELREAEDEIQTALSGLVSERDEVKAESDACYKKVREERNRVRRLVAEASYFRDTRNQVRKLLEGGEREEAVEKANAVMEKWFAEKWNADQDYRRFYLQNQARHQYKKASIDEIQSELRTSEAKRKKGGESNPSVTESPQDVVAALLEKANAEWSQAKKSELLKKSNSPADKASVSSAEEQVGADRSQPESIGKKEEEQPKVLPKVAVKEKVTSNNRQAQDPHLNAPSEASMEFELPSALVTLHPALDASDIVIPVEKANPKKKTRGSKKLVAKPTAPGRVTDDRKTKIAKKADAVKSAPPPKEVLNAQPDSSEVPSSAVPSDSQKPERSESAGNHTVKTADNTPRPSINKRRAMKRVKRNGKIVILPADQSMPKGLDQNTLIYLWPMLVGVLLAFGALLHAR